MWTNFDTNVIDFSLELVLPFTANEIQSIFLISNLLDKLSHNYRILSRTVSELVFIVAVIVLPRSIYPNIKRK